MRVPACLAALILGACTVDQAPPEPTVADANLIAFYSEAEARLRAQGGMRTETNPSDAPFGVDELVENFTRIALFDEFKVSGRRFVASNSPAELRRWVKPVRVDLLFGDSVTRKQRESDTANVRRFTRRLAKLTGLDMRNINKGPGNFTVMFLNRSEQRDFSAELSRRNIDAPAVIDAFRNSPPEAFCVAYTFGSGGNSNTFEAALILVKAEQRGLMRLSCIHEEMAQAMGLSNDSFDARPSIFNDDEEFALMTLHDEVLLRMLYDKRLRPGMTAAEARPLLPKIAADAMQAAGIGGAVALR
ncbi:DUF2927 domain-containing protein [Halovulum sp. GXIMD14793]